MAKSWVGRQRSRRSRTPRWVTQRQLQEIKRLSGILPKGVPNFTFRKAQLVVAALQNGQAVALPTSRGPLALHPLPRKRRADAPASANELREIERLTGIRLEPAIGSPRARRMLDALTSEKPCSANIDGVLRLFVPRPLAEREPSADQLAVIRELTPKGVTADVLSEADLIEAVIVLGRGDIWKNDVVLLEPYPANQRAASLEQLAALRSMCQRDLSAMGLTAHDAATMIELLSAGEVLAIERGGEVIELRRIGPTPEVHLASRPPPPLSEGPRPRGYCVHHLPPHGCDSCPPGHPSRWKRRRRR